MLKESVRGAVRMLVRCLYKYSIQNESWRVVSALQMLADSNARCGSLSR